ncbi:hypothetical protein ACLKA7_009856 [Drosophila subpalustris]
MYDSHISTRTQPSCRQWERKSEHHMGGWLVRIVDYHGHFACCGAYVAPLIVLSSANCMKPIIGNLANSIVEGIAMLSNEDNFARIEQVITPKNFKENENFMDIAVVKLMRPIRAWNTVYRESITKRVKVSSRQWGGLESNTGSNMGGWLIRITNGDGGFACCGAYFAPLLVITSANCMEPFRWNLAGATADGTALTAEEIDNYAQIEIVFVPDEFVAGQTNMDIALLKLQKPIKGKMTEFIKLCTNPPDIGIFYNAYAWGYSSYVVQQPSENPRTSVVPFQTMEECEKKFKEGFLSPTVFCVTHPKDRRDCLYDGGSPLTYKNELCGVASIGSSCQNTSTPGVFTSILQVKKYILKIEKGVKSGALIRQQKNQHWKSLPQKTMAQLKKLYMADRLEDLEELTVIPDISSKSLKMLLNTAKKLLSTADDYRLRGDQELAYISYMKYFNMLSIIRKKSDYAQNKGMVREELGDSDANRRIMDTLEQLSNVLTERYEALLPVNANTSAALISPPTKPIDVKSNSLTAHEAYATLGIISCEALFQRMQQKSVLVMDCRSSADYERSRLTYFCAFNVPEELITPGMSAGRLQARLSSSAKASWASRSVKESVVLMDWSSKDVQPGDNTPIATLLDILKNWDPDVTYRAPIQILDGGYQHFKMMYPTQCTNPSVERPQQNNNVIDTIDDIEYPSISDITMKEDILNADNSKDKQRPSINRANKPTTLRIHEPSQQNHQLQLQEQINPINEIMRHQAELLKRAQYNDMLLDTASKKWRRMHAEGTTLTASDQELNYNLLQLESKAEDYKIENNRLRDKLNRYKEQQPQEKLQYDDDTTKHIESKIEERQRLDELHERERLERERQLAIAREAKRHYKPPPTEPAAKTSEGPSPSPMNGILKSVPFDQAAINTSPLYDRSTKPRNERPIATETATTRVRDFSPVVGQNVRRGLTGLKNLGNTCYMNSILQCLSNTPQLMEFCVSNKYKNYISRQNKTNGQIIEEVAALMKVLWNGQYKCVASRDLRYVVGQYQKIFSGVDQQDSHEFLTILMDWLHSDLQTLKVPPKPEIKRASEKAWLEFTKSQESLILHLFYGQIKSTVKCVTCSMESATYECFSNLSLELPPNSNFCHLNQCMDMYFSGEKIHGWNCPTCKTKRDAIKKLDISKLPPVLVVHLKRFYADPSNTGAYIKKQNYLEFPLENLDMKPYIARAESRTQTPKTYKLYAVSNHYGTMEGGHYTAFCKSDSYGRWYKFDDQVVSTLDSSNVVSSAAYILFYTWLPPVDLSD